MSHFARQSQSSKAVRVLLSTPSLIFQILLSSYFALKWLRAPSAIEFEPICKLHLKHLIAADGVDLAAEL